MRDTGIEVDLVPEPKQKQSPNKKLPKPEIEEGTSIAQESLNRDREAMGMSLVPGKQNGTAKEYADEAIRLGLIDDVHRIATAIHEGIKETLNKVEMSAFRMKLRDLMKHYLILYDAINFQSDAELRIIDAEMTRIRQEFDYISQAAHFGTSEAAKTLRAAQDVIDSDFNILTILRLAKAAKNGKLTPKQQSRIEELVKKLNKVTRERDEANKKLRDTHAMRVVKKQGKSDRVKRGNASVKTEIESLYDTLTRLAEAGCNV